MRRHGCLGIEICVLGLSTRLGLTAVDEKEVALADLAVDSLGGGETGVLAACSRQ